MRSFGWLASLSILACATVPPPPRVVDAHDVKRALVALHAAAVNGDAKALHQVIDDRGRFALAYSVVKRASQSTPESSAAFNQAVGGFGVGLMLCIFEGLVPRSGSVDPACLNHIEIAHAPAAMQPVLPTEGPLSDGVLTLEEFGQISNEQTEKTMQSLREIDVAHCEIVQIDRIDPSTLSPLATVSTHVTKPWLDEVDGFFLSQLQCGERPGFVVATQYRRSSELRLLAWRF